MTKPAENTATLGLLKNTSKGKCLSDKGRKKGLKNQSLPKI